MPEFDHAVILARERMDEARDLFERLGFLVAPRGFHTLGSINHVIVLGKTYLELVGFPAGQADARPELRDAAVGLNGLVFRSDDAQATHELLLGRGAPVLPVQQFSRPVQLGEVTWDAVFRTVRTPPATSPAGRLYFCEHRTPELVWRRDWQRHPNGALELTAVEVRVRDAEREGRLYRQLLGEASLVRQSDGWLVSAPPVAIHLRRDAQRDRMDGLTIAVRELTQTATLLAAAGFRFESANNLIRLDPSEVLDVALQFTQA